MYNWGREITRFRRRFCYHPSGFVQPNWKSAGCEPVLRRRLDPGTAKQGRARRALATALYLARATLIRHSSDRIAPYFVITDDMVPEPLLSFVNPWYIQCLYAFLILNAECDKRILGQSAAIVRVCRFFPVEVCALDLSCLQRVS